MVVRQVMVVMVLLLGKDQDDQFICSMQRGGRIFKFTEEEFKMITYIINEDLTYDYQKTGEAQLKPQDVCNRAKPPMMQCASSVCSITE